MKFLEPVEITAEYRITTPLFLGGAMPHESIDNQQFRNASLKGALRFWWRALNWGRMLKAAAGNEAEALKALHRREGEIFGHASDGTDSEQSRVQLVSQFQGGSIVQPGAQLRDLVYLLGQGLYSHNLNGPAACKGTQRPYINGGQLTITARLKPRMPAQDAEAVVEALTALGLLGGIGSRARKGLGSLALQSIRYSGRQRHYNSLADITQFLGTLDCSAPAKAPLTAFTQASRIDLSMQGRNAEHLLAAIGKEQQLYRSFGLKGMVGRDVARQNFVDDHDIARTAASITGPVMDIKGLPRRAVFGLPHNYHFSSLTKGDLNIAPAGEGRRASPLLIHIHQLPNGDCLAIQTLMPGLFLPDGTALEVRNPKIKPDRQRAKHLTDYSVNYRVIHDYLDGFNDRKVLRHAQ